MRVESWIYKRVALVLSHARAIGSCREVECRELRQGEEPRVTQGRKSGEEDGIGKGLGSVGGATAETRRGKEDMMGDVRGIGEACEGKGVRGWVRRALEDRVAERGSVRKR